MAKKTADKPKADAKGTKKKSLRELPTTGPFAKLAGKGAKNWEAAKKAALEEGGITDFEDGVYVSDLADYGFQGSSSTGRPMFFMEWRMAEGEYEGKTTRRFYMLDDEEKGVVWLNRDLIKLGFEPIGNPQELKETADELLEAGLRCRIRLATRGEYQNLNIMKVLEEGVGQEEAEEEIDVDSMDKDELLALIEERELDIEKPKKLKLKALRKAVTEALEAEGEEEEEEEGEEEEEEGEEEEEESEEEESEEEEEESEEEEEESEEEEEEEVVIDKGDEVTGTHGGKKFKGTVTKVSEKTGTCTIKTSKGKTLEKVPVDGLKIVG